MHTLSRYTPTPNTETWCNNFLYFMNKTNCRRLFLCSSWKSLSHFPLGFLMPHQRVQTLTLPPKWCETASLHKRASKAVIRSFVELKSSSLFNTNIKQYKDTFKMNYQLFLFLLYLLLSLKVKIRNSPANLATLRTWNLIAHLKNNF